MIDPEQLPDDQLDPDAADAEPVPDSPDVKNDVVDTEVAPPKPDNEGDGG
jgi:hypothetical protein